GGQRRLRRGRGVHETARNCCRRAGGRQPSLVPNELRGSRGDAAARSLAERACSDVRSGATDRSLRRPWWYAWCVLGLAVSAEETGRKQPGRTHVRSAVSSRAQAEQRHCAGVFGGVHELGAAAPARQPPVLAAGPDDARLVPPDLSHPDG
ncbi:unnamed protein product, partial [Ectocarpus sp. 12 AP-2014]